MFTVLLVLHGFLSLCLVGLVLLQQGKGADMGATIGGGGSSSVFGGAGAVDFVAKLTTGLAIAFMCTSILLIRAYAYRAPSVSGTKSGDFLKGSLFGEADEFNEDSNSDATALQEGSVKGNDVGDVSEEAGAVEPDAAVAAVASVSPGSEVSVVNAPEAGAVAAEGEKVSSLPDSGVVGANSSDKVAPIPEDAAPGVGLAN